MTDDQPTPPKDKDSENWAQRLGRRSAGLPPTNPTRRSSETDPSDAAESRRLWRLAGLGIQFAGTTALFFFLGQMLDRHMHWPNTAAITGAVIAIVGSLYLIIKEGINQNKPPRPKP